MSPSNEAEVLVTVTKLIREIVQDEWTRDVEIGMQTSFSNDLELESIEFVALAERLRETFGREVDFAGWLAKKELKQILELRVGELVQFVLECASKPPTA